MVWLSSQQDDRIWRLMEIWFCAEAREIEYKRPLDRFIMYPYGRVPFVVRIRFNHPGASGIRRGWPGWRWHRRE
jgi:hypothetical protein